MNTKRFSLLILTLLLSASAAVAQPKKTAKPVKEYTIEQFMNTVRIGGSSFSSEETSRAKGATQRRKGQLKAIAFASLLLRGTTSQSQDAV